MTHVHDDERDQCTAGASKPASTEILSEERDHTGGAERGLDEMGFTEREERYLNRRHKRALKYGHLDFTRGEHKIDDVQLAVPDNKGFQLSFWSIAVMVAVSIALLAFTATMLPNYQKL